MSWVNLFTVVEILRVKSRLSEERQKEFIQGAIDYFTSARDCQLFLNQKITSYDIRGSYEVASDNLTEFRELTEKGLFDKFKFSSEFSKDYLVGLNRCITALNTIKNAPENIDRNQKEELSDFLVEYQKQLNIGS